MPNKEDFTLTIPHHRRQFTLASIGYGALLLGWLSIEDAHVVIVSLLGTGLAVMLIALSMIRWMGGRTLSLGQWLPGGFVLGGSAGFSAVLCIIGLMVFKNAWHSHAFPDFPAEVVAEMLERIPTWTVVGMLFGQSLALLRFTFHLRWTSA